MCAQTAHNCSIKTYFPIKDILTIIIRYQVTVSKYNKQLYLIGAFHCIVAVLLVSENGFVNKN